MNTSPATNPDALSKYTVSFGLALAVTSVFNALLVVAKETHQTTVMAWMKRATGQHWATHTLFSLVLFLGLGLMLARTRSGQGPQVSADRLVKAIVGGVVLGGLIIFSYYLFWD